MRKKFLSFILLIGVIFSSILFGACGKDKEVDYAAKVKLDLSSSTTLKQEVTVLTYIDGDTTHFKVPTSIESTGKLKARYLAVNTPESTGKIEVWGKKASKYTRSKLEAASEKGGSIVIESDSNKWEVDSTGERYLVWVWYKTPEMSDYRCLNIELLQEGLAVGSSTSDTRYGEVCMNAISQANSFKKHVHNPDEKDPDFFYGEAIPVTLKELRFNLDEYNGQKVSFEGVVTQYSNNGFYIEDYDNIDEDTGTYYGMYVYYGFFLDSYGIELLQEGNRMRIVGSVQYYEAGDTYQISDLRYNVYKPKDPNGIQLISENNAIKHKLTTAEIFTSKVDVIVTEDGEEVSKELPYAQVALNTTISMNGLTVNDIYTTNSGDNEGAMTLTCTVDGKTVTVRTMKIYQADGTTLVTKADLLHKTIDVKGVVDVFDGEYQIKVFAFDDIVVH